MKMLVIVIVAIAFMGCDSQLRKEEWKQIQKEKENQRKIKVEQLLRLPDSTNADRFVSTIIVSEMKIIIPKEKADIVLDILIGRCQRTQRERTTTQSKINAKYCEIWYKNQKEKGKKRSMTLIAERQNVKIPSPLYFFHFVVDGDTVSVGDTSHL